MNIVTIFTDGSSRGNPGPGGWGSVVIITNSNTEDFPSQVIEVGGYEDETTNNRMELTAVIHGLQKAGNFGDSDTINRPEIYQHTQIKIYSDSSYVINGITKWIHGWKKNNWKTKTKNDVLNIDLWKKLDEIVSDIVAENIFWEYVGGHVGVVGNERCDQIATAFADKKDPRLYIGHFSGYSIKNILDVSHDETSLKSKKNKSTRSKAKVYSYVSSVGGEIGTHNSWIDCEKRVKGTKGALFKKSFSLDDERRIINEWNKKN